MKFVDEYRDAELCQRLIGKIKRRASSRWVLMDVCGGQTHSLLRNGIEDAIVEKIELIHGPGCPVCVTSTRAIDLSQTLAQSPGVMLTSFGDMLRVPGSCDSLMNVRAKGGKVTTVYSPIDAVDLAAANPDQQVVFFAVGFETTAPATALAVLQAARLELTNFSLLVSHVRVGPAMRALMSEPDCRIDAFLAAGHVCTITGTSDYAPFIKEHRVPVVVTGFEPVDLLQGILAATIQLEQNEAKLENCYGRSVESSGNRAARLMVDRVFEVCDRDWRGIGTIQSGGFRLRDEFAAYDAQRKFVDLTPLPIVPSESKCRSADVMSGRIKPPECVFFGNECTADHPLGAPMVSSEGACAAYDRYRSDVDSREPSLR